MIGIDRLDPESRTTVAHALVQRATEPGWPQTLIFPVFNNYILVCMLQRH